MTDSPGAPRTQIRLPALFFDAVHKAIAESDWPNTSAWLRHLLREWDGQPLERAARPEYRQLSVRLDERHRARLAQLAESSGVSQSHAFAQLVLRALQAPLPSYRATVLPEPARPAPAPPPEPAPAPTPARPASTDWERWAALVLEAARSVPADRRIADGRKVWIADVVDRLVSSLAPEDPPELAAQIRSILPQLNQLDLVPLVRYDLSLDHLGDLPARSEVQHLNATFHLVQLR